MNNAKTTEIIRVSAVGTLKLLELKGLNATILFRTFYRKMELKKCLLTNPHK